MGCRHGWIRSQMAEISGKILLLCCRWMMKNFAALSSSFFLCILFPCYMLYIMQLSINSKGHLLSHALAVRIRLPLPPPFLSVPPPAANLGLSLAQLLLLNSPSCWFQNVSNRADPDLKALWQRKRRIDVSPLLSPISSRQHLTLVHFLLSKNSWMLDHYPLDSSPP